MNLRINPIVVEDLKEIRDYIKEDNPDMATKVINGIYERFEYLGEFPDIGRDLSQRVNFRTNLKFIVHGNYLTLYRVKRDCVEIYRVVNRYQDVTSIIFHKD